MKKLLFVAFLGLLLSCEKEDLSLSQTIGQNPNLETLDYLGEKITLQNGLTKLDVEY